MNFLFKKKAFPLILLSLIMTLSTGCATADAIENEQLEIFSTQTTITEITTSAETTTNILNYIPNLTVCSMYEPNDNQDETSTFETTTTPTETTTQLTTIDNTTTNISDSTEKTSNDDDTITETDNILDNETTNITTITQPIETIPTTKKFETILTTTVTTQTEPPLEVNVDNNLIDSSYFFNECAFIGDSLTVGLGMYDLIPKEYSFAKEGITIPKMTTSQLSTNYGYLYPAQAISSWNSKHVFILLGINGVTWISNSSAIESYTQLINDIRNNNPQVEDINVISVLPVAYSKETIDTVANGRILNSEVDVFNQSLEEMAYTLGVNYIDVNSYLKNEYNCLPSDLTVDGLHLTKSGYEKVVEVLLEYVRSN